MKRNRPERQGVVLFPVPGEGLPWKAIELLEALRDKTKSEEWVNPVAKHYVLFGIKLCIQLLRKEDINEIT